MSRSRSVSVRVGDSPVVPHGTRPSMPARICQRTSRRKAASSRVPSGGERRDERGEGAAQHRPGRPGRRGGPGGGGAGHRSAPFGARWSVVRRRSAGRERRSSSTMGSNGWRPAGRGARRQPVGGGEDPGRVGRAVARGEAQLDGLAGGIEADEVHPGRRAGPDRDDLEVVRSGQPRMAVDDPLGQVARGAGRPVELGPAMPLDEVRIERVDRARRARPPGRSSRPKSATPRLKFDAATARRRARSAGPRPASDRRSSRSSR